MSLVRIDEKIPSGLWSPPRVVLTWQRLADGTTDPGSGGDSLLQFGSWRTKFSGPGDFDFLLLERRGGGGGRGSESREVTG